MLKAIVFKKKNERLLKEIKILSLVIDGVDRIKAIYTDRKFTKTNIDDFFSSKLWLCLFYVFKALHIFHLLFLKLLKFKTKGKPLVCSIVLKNKSHPYM